MASLSATFGVALDDLSRRERSLRRSLSVARVAVGMVLWMAPATGARMVRRITRDMALVHLTGLRSRDLVASLADRQEILDADFAIVDGLQRVKDGALRIRASALRLAAECDKVRRMAPIADEARQLAAVSAECYATLAQVQTDVQEHDADYSPRVNDATADNAKDLEALLSRLATSE